MSSIEWVAPPARRSGQHARAYKLAKQFAAKPNQWGKISKYKSYSSAASRASNIRSGKLQGWNDVGTFEAMVRTTGPDEYSLYVRCIFVKKEKNRVED